MYLGSSVPHITKDGLQGIQEPLSELYPDKATLASGNAGIDSWLSVWSNGILIENVDETGREVKRFFKIDALHYCAAVKFVPQLKPHLNNSSTALPKFLPLDSPHARQSDSSNPPIFACILRRTTGIKVLECHAFICKREAAANALVRCCFHAYADTMYAKQIGADVNTISNDINKKTLDNQSHASMRQQQHQGPMESRNADDHQSIGSRRSKSITDINRANCQQVAALQHEKSMTMRPTNGHYSNGNCDTSDNLADNLRKQQKLSKSMHHLNQHEAIGMTYDQLMMEQANHDYEAFHSNQSTSASCVNIPNTRWAQQQDPRQMQQVPLQHQPFYNPYASRVPSYPPQNLMDTANGGGTLRSIKSMAANSIASTLLRSKKHAKAMSMAQLNQEKITSFHQPHSNHAPTMGGPLMMPPVPPMFMPNLATHTMMSGSRTLKAPPMKPMLPMMGPMNFEAMTPKEMKKLLKKSAKYGIDPSKFGENGLPLLPLRSPPMPPPTCHMPPPPSKSGTMVSQQQLMFSDIYGAGGHDIPDMAALHGMPQQMMDHSPMKPILVKPNPEFLKSKAGKKWLKQQKEFKKLLPPHLDGLPIIFGPPPPDALEPATLPPANHIQAPAYALPLHPGLPMMDSSGFYNPHPFYGQNGRASAASTLMRYSPHSQLMHENGNGYANPDASGYMHGNHMIYGNNIPVGPSSLASTQRGDYTDDSSMIMSNNGCNVDAHGRSFVDDGHEQQRRNHMVEQSIISLGDENDLDDDDDEDGEAGNDCQQGYDRVPLRSNNNNNNEDQSSYSSGIYKKGHINERAFSYSIRQEHKSSGNLNSDNNEYISRNEVGGNPNRQDRECHPNHDHQQQHLGNIYQNNKRDQNGEYYRSSNNNNGLQTLPVNELTARLENQLSMNTFSRIKSHV